MLGGRERRDQSGEFGVERDAHIAAREAFSAEQRKLGEVEQPLKRAWRSVLESSMD